MKSLAALIIVFALSASAADYGEKTRFEKGRPLTFPDCELVFQGTRKVSSPVYTRGFVNYDFQARAGGKTADVSWSEGTGLIAPKLFTINGEKFVLELKGSKAFKGWLKDNELVLWKQADFEKLQR